MVSGVVGGCAAGMCVWLSYASQFEGGLSAETFVRNTGELDINRTLVFKVRFRTVRKFEGGLSAETFCKKYR